MLFKLYCVVPLTPPEFAWKPPPPTPPPNPPPPTPPPVMELEVLKVAYMLAIWELTVLFKEGGC